MATDIRFSLILPLYRNEANLPALLQCIAEMQASLGAGFEAVFVVDGSPDDCYGQLKARLPEQAFHSQLLLHS